MIIQIRLLTELFRLIIVRVFKNSKYLMNKASSLLKQGVIQLSSRSETSEIDSVSSKVMTSIPLIGK